MVKRTHLSMEIFFLYFFDVFKIDRIPTECIGKTMKIELWENYKKNFPKEKKTLEINRLSYFVKRQSELNNSIMLFKLETSKLGRF